MGGKKTGGVVRAICCDVFRPRQVSRLRCIYLCPSLSIVFNNTYPQSVSLLHNMPLQTAP